MEKLEREFPLRASFGKEDVDMLSRLDPSFDESSEMDSEKRKLRVRHRINQVAHQVLSPGLDFVVLAPEGNDADFAPFSRQDRHAVAMQAGAVDKVLRLEVARRGAGHPAGGL